MLEISKHEKLYRELKKELIMLNPGDKVPSVRNIMQDYSVSQATVTKSISRLNAENLIEKSLGLGTFVTDEVLKYKKNAAPIILVATPRWSSPWYVDIENTFELAKKKYNISVEFLHFDWKDEIPRTLPDIKIDGLVVVPAPNSITPEHIAHLNSFNIPYSLFDISADNLPVNSVSSNNHSIGALAADHLVKLGHNKIAVVISEPKVVSINESIEGFQEYCELQGVEVEVIDCGVESGDLGVEKVYDVFSNRLKNAPCDFTGIFVTASPSVLGVYKAVYEHNFTIPGDLSIISAGDYIDCAYYYPALTNISLSTPELTSSAIEILLSRIKDNPKTDFSQKKIKPKIIIRESTRKI